MDPSLERWHRGTTSLQVGMPQILQVECVAAPRHQGWGKRRLLPGTRDGGEKVLGDERLAPILAMVGSMPRTENLLEAYRLL